MAASDPTEGQDDKLDDKAAIQADIEKTRADLADTVDALSSKLTDQKAQAKSAMTKVGIAAGVGVAVLVVVKIVKARRSR